MAIAHDAVTRFPAVSGVDTTTGDRSFTHTPTGTPKGVVVMLLNQSNAAVVTGVSYGGVQMRQLHIADDVTEVGRVTCFVLTDSIVPTGAQTVILQGCTATNKWCTVATVTAATNASTVNTSATEVTTSADPGIILTTTATTMVYLGIHSGGGAPSASPGAGCTLVHNHDYGTLMSQTVRQTNAVAAGNPDTFVTLASDDYSAIAVAIAESTVNDLPNLVTSVWS